jgi:EAL domain-containing protein (putative c-di-GMP-specific phosphodiesterase class I)
MYIAKERNLGFFVYESHVDRHSPERLALLGELRRAIEHEELVLHYQPKVDVGSGRLVGAEALVRWLHPEHGMVMPDSFIPLAEHTGIIGPLTRYVVDAALAQARTWTDQGNPLAVSVNLSARNLLDEDLPDMVAELLDIHELPATLLELEVTESALMVEPARARHVLERLARLGIRISIDDFGTGYTSLSQLKTLPVGELKLDRSFVTTMIEDLGNAHIVRSLIELGHNLGLSIVAEGVETAEVLMVLEQFRCDVAQGYYLSPPVPATAFDAWRASRRTAAALDA